MKKNLAKLLLLILLSISLSTCKKEDLTGSVNITFENHPVDLEIVVFTLENTQIAIFSNLKPDSHGSFTKVLNPGNYYFVPNATTIYGTIACQIQSGVTTTIYYDNYNVPHLKSKK